MESMIHIHFYASFEREPRAQCFLYEILALAVKNYAKVDINSIWYSLILLNLFIFQNKFSRRPLIVLAVILITRVFSITAENFFWSSFKIISYTIFNYCIIADQFYWMLSTFYICLIHLVILDGKTLVVLKSPFTLLKPLVDVQWL